MSELAVSLTAKYGKGFDSSNLYKYLAFFKRFPILDTVCPKSGMRLGWSHYRVILQVENDEALRWYLDEAAAEIWVGDLSPNGMLTQMLKGLGRLSVVDGYVSKHAASAAQEEVR